jgi:hypothetical protein
MSSSKKPRIDDTQSTSLLPDISPLIWMHGPGPGSRGSVLVILAQNGYTREAHKIISLSRIASLIGRDSDGGLPELWDVMGKVRGKGGITRLMAICITRGSLSPQRALSLIRDHNVDVRARDDQERTTLHYALAYKTPINTDLIRVLIEACSELVKKENYKGFLPLYYAIVNKAPFDIIRLLIDTYPEGFQKFLQEVSLEKFSLSTLVVLAKEKAVKENSKAAEYVSWAIGKIALCDTGRQSPIDACQSCIDAGAPLALTELAKEKAVKEDSEAARNVAFALCNIACSETGRQSCIAAGAPLALVALAKEKTVKENSEAASNVAAALGHIAESETGRQSCIAAGAPLALTELAKEKAVKEYSYAARNVACALGNIAESETGCQSCIAAGAPFALTDLAKEKTVKENSETAENVALALGNISKSETGRQSCIDAGAPLALTELAKEKAVKEDAHAASNVAYALSNIAKSETGRQSCIDAGAPLALTELAKEKAVKENSEAARNVANAYKIITGIELK